jgi:ferric-dicitrate binding protein FerR (iron transport regulator)
MKKQHKYSSENQFYSNLENYQSLDVEGDWKLVKDRMGFRKTRKPNSLFQVAAILILLLSFGFLSKVYLFDPPEIIIAATGEEKQEFTLPDGSQVHLNVHSELSYPEKFRRNSRKVSLTGEGFFKISRDPGMPFLVNISDQATVEVLGTSFNIESNITNNEVRVQVVEGRVAFYKPDEKESRAIMETGDQAELQDGEIRMSINPDHNFLSWQTGILNFQQCPITDVVRQLEEHYERVILLDNDIPKEITFTTTIDNQEIEDVLEEMSLVLELIITYNPDAIRISRQN